MNNFSITRIKTFQQCPFKYKLRYIDHEKSELVNIEAMLGKVIHECLDILYKENLKRDQLITLFSNRFDSRIQNEPVRIVKSDIDYREQGIQMIQGYYDNFYLSDNLYTLETEIKITKKFNGYGFEGIIDRLAMDNLNNLYIIDYKTGKNITGQKTKQSLLYTKLVNDVLEMGHRIINYWIYLRYNCVKRYIPTTEEINQNIKNLINEIHKIESEADFFPKPSTLCAWCEFKEICQYDFFRLEPINSRSPPAPKDKR